MARETRRGPQGHGFEPPSVAVGLRLEGFSSREKSKGFPLECTINIMAVERKFGEMPACKTNWYLIIVIRRLVHKLKKQSDLLETRHERF